MPNLPPLYAPSTAPFWDDAYISLQMLKAHLDPDTDAASRKPAFLDASAQWIGALAVPGRLIDFGCGPGLYAERFARQGYAVTGVDISRRSIDYARRSAARQGLSIEYVCESYLDYAPVPPYDIAICIYCDYGVLSPADRAKLLRNVRAALRPGGVFVVDAISVRRCAAFREYTAVSHETGGFWREGAYDCVTTSAYYAATRNMLDQYVVTENGVTETYNIWNQFYDAASLEKELRDAGFARVSLFDDARGMPYTGDADTLCAAAYNP